MRRISKASLTSLLAAVGIVIGTATAAAQAGEAIESGGIGLTRAAWEAAHGPGAPIEIPFVFGDLYAYEGGTYYVQFEAAKPGGEAEATLIYLEVVWGGGGATYEEANVAVRSLLPADVGRPTDVFRAPPTPGGPVDLMMERYASPSLDAVNPEPLDLPAEILIIYHVHTSELDTPPGAQPLAERSVTRVSMTVATPEG